MDMYHFWSRPLTCVIFLDGVSAQGYVAYALTPIAPKAFLTFIASPVPTLLREHKDLGFSGTKA